LHAIKYETGIVVEFEYANNIGVHQPAANTPFFFQQLNHRRRYGIRCELEGNPGFGSPIIGEPYFSHATAANAPDEHVPAGKKLAFVQLEHGFRTGSR
jgi:hypothetical protein